MKKKKEVRYNTEKKSIYYYYYYIFTLISYNRLINYIHVVSRGGQRSLVFNGFCFEGMTTTATVSFQTHPPTFSTVIKICSVYTQCYIIIIIIITGGGGTKCKKSELCARGALIIFSTYNTYALAFVAIFFFFLIRNMTFFFFCNFSNTHLSQTNDIYTAIDPMSVFVSKSVRAFFEF